ncbi:MAG: hypothetical protein K2Z80_37455, partial [Xanthobacteraceae bacterium]|nr:hypothetical protein [Xanthobacteraceae bacterium]
VTIPVNSHMTHTLSSSARRPLPDGNTPISFSLLRVAVLTSPGIATFVAVKAVPTIVGNPMPTNVALKAVASFP